MKRLNEMTREELLSMTEEKRHELADLESAYEGIPLLPNKPQKPEVTYPERNVTIYSVDNHDFTDLEEAQRYCEFCNNLNSEISLEYDWKSLGSEFQYVGKEKLSKLSLEQKKVYSLDTYQELEAEIKRTQALEKQYNSQLSHYKSALSERTEIYKNIDSAVTKAWDEKHRENMLVNAYKKYKSLTGDGAVALKLLKDAYEVSEAEEKAVLAQDKPTS